MGIPVYVVIAAHSRRQKSMGSHHIFGPTLYILLRAQDIASSNPWQLVLHFEHDIDHTSASWTLFPINNRSAKDLVDSVQQSYRGLFKVPLRIDVL